MERKLFGDIVTWY